MVKVILKPVETSLKTVEIGSGKTIIGRGPLLECSDKKVSRNHAFLEVTDGGDIFLTPTHVNPCFYQAQSKGPSKVLKKDKAQQLASGDMIALLPNSFQYVVEVKKDLEKSSSSNVHRTGGQADNESNVSSKGIKSENNVVSKTDGNHTIAKTENGDTNLPASKESGSGSDSSQQKQSNQKKVKEEVPKPKPSKEESSDIKESKKEESTRTGKEDSLKAKVAKDSITKTKVADVTKNKEKTSKESGSKERTLPKWLLDSASTTLPRTTSKPKATPEKKKQSNNTVSKQIPQKRPSKQVYSFSESDGDDNAGKDDDYEGNDSYDDEDDDYESEPETRKRTSKFSEKPSKPSKTRSSRQNRSTMQRISLDDFVVSDDDEWDNSPEESKPRRRRQREDSGSDWEEENRKSKRYRRTVDSDSDSASDWEKRNKKKKAPTRTKTKRRKKQSDSEVSDFDEEESEPEVVKRRSTRQKRTNCKYGKKCFRKNAQHKKQFCHPGDSDYNSLEEDSGEDGEKDNEEEDEDQNDIPECQYGVDCFRKNSKHRKNFKHTKKILPQRAAAVKKGKKKKKAISDDDLDDSLANESGSDWEPEAGNVGGDQEINELVKDAKGFVKNKKLQESAD